MHKEVLSKKQEDVLPIIKTFTDDFILVGGTAIALLIGHRESIDFDLFTNKKFDNLELSRKIKEKGEIEHVIVDRFEEFTALINGVKITFLHYPYKINYEELFDESIKVPSILTLGAMKAYALGRRAKWKDYVDIYFISKRFNGVKEIVEEAKKMFGSEFNEKIFRSQLAYFEDIDFSEEVFYTEKFKVEDNIVKDYLREISLS
jgi:hypothetical protein